MPRLLEFALQCHEVLCAALDLQAAIPSPLELFLLATQCPLQAYGVASGGRKLLVPLPQQRARPRELCVLSCPSLIPLLQNFSQGIQLLRSPLQGELRLSQIFVYLLLPSHLLGHQSLRRLKLGIATTEQGTSLGEFPVTAPEAPPCLAECIYFRRLRLRELLPPSANEQLALVGLAQSLQLESLGLRLHAQQKLLKGRKAEPAQSPRIALRQAFFRNLRLIQLLGCMRSHQRRWHCGGYRRSRRWHCFLQPRGWRFLLGSSSAAGRLLRPEGDLPGVFATVLDAVLVAIHLGSLGQAGQMLPRLLAVLPEDLPEDLQVLCGLF
mmetsp:Transcript_60420/g.129564  ORF Transcript_60420/g.129564 Transcript_60420/m.129564 type:complete len:324 (+) Transcript_60420:154-1125(+)